MSSSRIAVILPRLASSALKTSGLRKSQEKLICTTPRFLPRAAIISSVIFRGAGEIARQEECDAKIGALLTSRASQNVLSETWEISTIIPNRFISAIISLPSAERPLLGFFVSPEESAQWL